MPSPVAMPVVKLPATGSAASPLYSAKSDPRRDRPRPEPSRGGHRPAHRRARRFRGRRRCRRCPRVAADQIDAVRGRRSCRATEPDDDVVVTRADQSTSSPAVPTIVGVSSRHFGTWLADAIDATGSTTAATHSPQRVTQWSRLNLNRMVPSWLDGSWGHSDGRSSGRFSKRGSAPDLPRAAPLDRCHGLALKATQHDAGPRPGRGAARVERLTLRPAGERAECRLAHIAW